MGSDQDHTMSIKPSIRYAHTDLIANDSRKLLAFYVEVFGCEPVSSERDHRGEYFDNLTAIPGAARAASMFACPATASTDRRLRYFNTQTMNQRCRLHSSAPALPTSPSRWRTWSRSGPRCSHAAGATWEKS